MTGNRSLNLSVRTVHSIHAIDAHDWDVLSAGLPFQSHRWYRFGERVMQDCEPVYLLAYQDETLVGRAALWVIRNEPLPLEPGVGRDLLHFILRHWPLLICRSPLSLTSGLVLPAGPSRPEALRALTRSAQDVSRQKRCSFLLFDYLSKDESQEFPEEFSVITFPETGTVMHNDWDSFEAYLDAGKSKRRHRYKKVVGEAQALGIAIEKHKCVPDLSAALRLIDEVDCRHNNPPNPWVRALLENIEMLDGTWLEASQNGITVSCAALLDDNGAQLLAGLGLTDNAPYAYLSMLYTGLEEAIQKKIHLLRWGSGAYEVKRRLGFDLDDNGCMAAFSNNFLARYLLHSFS